VILPLNIESGSNIWIKSQTGDHPFPFIVNSIHKRWPLWTAQLTFNSYSSEL
jgi:hypothetical protein